LRKGKEDFEKTKKEGLFGDEFFVFWPQDEE